MMTGEELRKRRIDAGLTQKALGEILGVAQNTVARWENEKMQIPGKMLSLAFEALECREKLTPDKPA